MNMRHGLFYSSLRGIFVYQAAVKTAAIEAYQNDALKAAVEHLEAMEIANLEVMQVVTAVLKYYEEQ